MQADSSQQSAVSEEQEAAVEIARGIVAEVDDYLAALKTQPLRPQLLPGSNLGCGSHGIGMGYVELRKKHMAAMERVKTKLEEVEGEFAAAFGRAYGGQI